MEEAGWSRSPPRWGRDREGELRRARDSAHPASPASPQGRRGTGMTGAHDPIPHHPGGQSRRDRVPHHAHGQGDGLPHGRRLLARPTPTRCTCAWPTSRRASARRRRQPSYLNIEAIIAAAKTARRRRGASGLRLPVRERRLRARLRARPASSSSARRPRPSPPWATRREAKRRMLEAGVPCVPGYQGADQSDAVLAREAERIGFPVMVKAAAGGGGRGMRLVAAKKDLAAALATARARGGERLRLRRADPGEGRERCPPRRDPGARRCARPCHTPRRARLLGAAPPPEGAGGGAVARRRCRAARAHGRSRRRRRQGHRLQQRRHGRVPARRPTAPSTSWR